MSLPEGRVALVVPAGERMFPRDTENGPYNKRRRKAGIILMARIKYQGKRERRE